MKQKKPWPCMDCRVIMLEMDADHCKCPVCGTEVWYDFSRDLPQGEVEQLMREKYKANLPQVEPLPVGVPKKGGGSRSAKKHGRSEMLKKKSVSQLYREL